MRSGVADASIYITADARGKGVATRLIKDLTECAQENGFYSIQAEIVKENIASYSLCKKVGFREIGFRERFGRMPDGTWHDMILMEIRSEE